MSLFKLFKKYKYSNSNNTRSNNNTISPSLIASYLKIYKYMYTTADNTGIDSKKREKEEEKQKKMEEEKKEEEKDKKSKEYPILLITNSNIMNEIYKKQIDDLNIRLYNRSEINTLDSSDNGNSNKDSYNIMLTTFDFYSFFKLLNVNNSLASTILFSNKVTSTQKIIHFPNSKNILYLANYQVAGQGRGGNTWTSPDGCLMLTFKTTTSKLSQLLFIQYIVCIALIDSISKLKLKDDNAAKLASMLKIKWPNDIYTTTNLKISGILCNSSSVDGGANLTIGIGINVLNDEPTTSLQKLLSEFSDEKLTKEEILACFLNNLDLYLKLFESNGFKIFEDSYYSKWLHSNQSILLNDINKNLVITGLTEYGYLLAIDPITNVKYELSPDGNTFDFMNGLISKKIVNKRV